MCKVGQLKAARELFSSLSTKGLHPTTQTYNIMIQGLFQEGLSIEASELLCEMRKNDCLLDDIAYNMIARGFLKNNVVLRGIRIISG